MIHCDPILEKDVIGVFAADQLPKTSLSKPYGLIVNTDIQSQPGRHWCAIYCDGNRRLDFFDSYGRHPRNNSFVIADWIEKRDKPYVYNRVQIQGNESSLCGLYSIFFLRQRISGFTLTDCVNMFSRDDLIANDQFVYNVTSYAYTHCINNENVPNQCCVPLVVNY